MPSACGRPLMLWISTVCVPSVNTRLSPTVSMTGFLPAGGLMGRGLSSPSSSSSSQSSSSGSQFLSAPIPVEAATDYALEVTVRVLAGRVNVGVVREGERAQGSDGVDKERVRAVERVDVAAERRTFTPITKGMGDRGLAPGGGSVVMDGSRGRPTTEAEWLSDPPAWRMMYVLCGRLPGREHPTNERFRR